MQESIHIEVELIWNYNYSFEVTKKQRSEINIMHDAINELHKIINEWCVEITDQTKRINDKQLEIIG